jgi:hypothetical protein
MPLECRFSNHHCYLYLTTIATLIKSRQTLKALLVAVTADKNNPNFATKPQRYMVKPIDRGEGKGIFIANTFDEIVSTSNEYMQGAVRCSGFRLKFSHDECRQKNSL